MALSQAASSIRALVLRHMRIPVQTNAGAASSLAILRGFAGGAYLDKDDVTERVLHVAKHFQRVDAAKVRGLLEGTAHGAWQAARASPAFLHAPQPPCRAWPASQRGTRPLRAEPAASPARCR